jgi:hypothetical protein
MLEAEDETVLIKLRFNLLQKQKNKGKNFISLVLQETIFAA